MKIHFIRVAFLIVMAFPVSSFAQEEMESLDEIRSETALEHVGDVAQFAPAALSVFAILIHNDKEGAWQFVKSVGANLAATYIIKYAINKKRPNGAPDGHAFPSGHTSAAFQGASFVQKRYGWEYGIPAYVVAGFVGYSRVEGLNDRHDWYDVIAGAVVGIGSSYLFTTPYLQDHYKLTFNSGNGDFLIGINYKF